MTTLSARLLEVLTDKPTSKWDLQEMLVGYDPNKGRYVCPSEREIRRSIAELRSLGYNIASNSDHDNRGYWLGSEKDKVRTIKELRSRAAKLNTVADALERGPILGQMEMKL